MINEELKLIELFETLKTYSDNKELYISKLIDNAIFFLTNRRAKENVKLNSEKIDQFSYYTKEVLTDIYGDYLDRSGSKNNIADDIEYVGIGFTSITFRVGDNVIKLGKGENKPFSSKLDSVYQVPTYIRESYEIDNKTYFRVEVAPYVDTTNITYEDSYEAYSNIRDLGYIWNDPKEENLGRIIGIGGCKIRGKKYMANNQYKKGDLVIIDLDDISYVGEETSDDILEEISMMSYNRNVYRFETRHMKEKEEQKVNKI